jgi:hypothetical protein
LYGEWENSRNSGESGPTEIVISESNNSVQIRENEQRIMPMDIFGATLKTTNNSQHNICNLLENDGAYGTLAENLRDWFGKSATTKLRSSNVKSAAESVMEAAVTKLIPYTPEEIKRYNRWAERNGQSYYNSQHLFRGSVGDKMMFVGKGTPVPVEVIGLDQSLPTAVTVRTLDGSNKELDMDWINYRDQVQLRPMTPAEQSMHANELRGELAEGSEKADDVISTLNSFGYYTNNGRLYTKDGTGDKIIRQGERWKHNGGKFGNGKDELDDFLSKKGVAETNMAQAASRSSTDTSKTSKKLNWNNIPNHLTVDERAEIFEQYMLRGNLKESNNERAQESFDTLFGMSDKLIKNNNYFVVPLILINNRLLSMDQPQYLKFIRKETNELVFYSDSSEKKYPHNLIRDIASYHVFAFENSNSYDKFRTVVALKFDYNLPDFKFDSSNDIDETTMTQAASRSSGPKFGGYYGATQKGPPKKNQGFGGAAESVGHKLKHGSKKH